MTAHTWVNGLRGAWYNGRVATGSDFLTLDASIFGCINGDGGGNGTPWTPAATILIGGAGMWAAAEWTIGAAGIVACGTNTTNVGPQKITSIVSAGGAIQVTVSGPFGPGTYTNGDLIVITGVQGTTEANGTWQVANLVANVFQLQGSTFVNAYTGGGLVTELQSQFTLGDNDYFQLQAGHSARSRVIVTPCATAQAIPQLWSTNPITPGGSPVYGLASLVPGAGMDVPLRVHNGATLVGATLTFIVGQTHAGIPQVLPGVRLVGMNMAGVAFPLATAAVTSGTDATGMQFVPTPASGAAWYALGVGQTFTFTCDPGIVIDTTGYTYHAVVQDEFGANALTGNIYVELELSFANIPDQKPQ